MIPSKTSSELIKQDMVHVGYDVTYECIHECGGWGEVGNTNRIRYGEYNLTKFTDTAPKGWIIRAIDPVYMVDR